MSVRTSLTHPLRINTVTMPGGGRLGLTFCPGKKQKMAMTGAWDRDLQLDLQAVKAWGAAGVLTLLEPQEMVDLGVPALGAEIQKQGMLWHHIYLPNDAVPDAAYMNKWNAGRAAMHRQLDAGQGLLIHCMGGIGRTAQMAAMLLMERGISAGQAMADIAAVREGVFCVPEQVAFLHQYKPAALLLPKNSPSP